MREDDYVYLSSGEATARSRRRDAVKGRMAATCPIPREGPFQLAETAEVELDDAASAKGRSAVQAGAASPAYEGPAGGVDDAFWTGDETARAGLLERWDVRPDPAGEAAPEGWSRRAGLTGMTASAVAPLLEAAVQAARGLLRERASRRGADSPADAGAGSRSSTESESWHLRVEQTENAEARRAAAAVRAGRRRLEGVLGRFRETACPLREGETIKVERSGAPRRAIVDAIEVHFHVAAVPAARVTALEEAGLSLPAVGGEVGEGDIQVWWEAEGRYYRRSDGMPGKKRAKIRARDLRLEEEARAGHEEAEREARAALRGLLQAERHELARYLRASGRLRVGDIVHLAGVPGHGAETRGAQTVALVEWVEARYDEGAPLGIGLRAGIVDEDDAFGDEVDVHAVAWDATHEVVLAPGVSESAIVRRLLAAYGDVLPSVEQGDGHPGGDGWADRLRDREDVIARLEATLPRLGALSACLSELRGYDTGVERGEAARLPSGGAAFPMVPLVSPREEVSGTVELAAHHIEVCHAVPVARAAASIRADERLVDGWWVLREDAGEGEGAGAVSAASVRSRRVTALATTALRVVGQEGTACVVWPHERRAVLPGATGGAEARASAVEAAVEQVGREEAWRQDYAAAHCPYRAGEVVVGGDEVRWRVERSGAGFVPSLRDHGLKPAFWWSLLVSADGGGQSPRLVVEGGESLETNATTHEREPSGGALADEVAAEAEKVGTLGDGRASQDREEEKLGARTLGGPVSEGRRHALVEMMEGSGADVVELFVVDGDAARRLVGRASVWPEPAFVKAAQRGRAVFYRPAEAEGAGVRLQPVRAEALLRALVEAVREGSDRLVVRLFASDLEQQVKMPPEATATARVFRLGAAEEQEEDVLRAREEALSTYGGVAQETGVIVEAPRLTSDRRTRGAVYSSPRPRSGGS